MNLIIVSWLSAVLAEKIFCRTWVMLLMTVPLAIGISTVSAFLGFLVLTYTDNSDSGKWFIINLLMSSSAGTTYGVKALSSVLVSSFVGSILAPVGAYLMQKLSGPTG